MVHFELVFPYGMRLRLRPFIYLRMCSDSGLVLWAHEGPLSGSSILLRGSVAFPPPALPCLRYCSYIVKLSKE